MGRASAVESKKAEEEGGGGGEGDGDDDGHSSDGEKSVRSEATDKGPGTPQFQFSRLKTRKTYARKSEPALADPDDLETSDSDEGSDDSIPVVRGPRRSLASRENGDVKEASGGGGVARSTWKVEQTPAVEEDPARSKPSIVSRITKALTSRPRDLGTAAAAAATAAAAAAAAAAPLASASKKLVGKAKPVTCASRDLALTAASKVVVGKAKPRDLGKAKTPSQTLKKRSNPSPLAQGGGAKPKKGRRSSLKTGGGEGGGEENGTAAKGEASRCSVCGKVFRALYRFRAHVKSHSAGKRYCCDVS